MSHVLGIALFLYTFYNKFSRIGFYFIFFFDVRVLYSVVGLAGNGWDGMEWMHTPFFTFRFLSFFEFSFTRRLMATTFHCICDDVVVVNCGL